MSEQGFGQRESNERENSRASVGVGPTCLVALGRVNDPSVASQLAGADEARSRCTSVERPCWEDRVGWLDEMLRLHTSESTICARGEQRLAVSMSVTGRVLFATQAISGLTSGSPVLATTMLAVTDSTTNESCPDAAAAAFSSSSRFFSFPLPRPPNRPLFFFSALAGGDSRRLMSRGIEGNEAGIGNGGGLICERQRTQSEGVELGRRG